MGNIADLTNSGLSLYNVYNSFQEAKISDEQLIYKVYLEAKLNSNLINSIKLSSDVKRDDKLIIELANKMSILNLEILLLQNKRMLKETQNPKNKNFLLNKVSQLIKKSTKKENEVKEIIINGSKSFNFIDACEFAYIKLNEILILSSLSSDSIANKKTNYKTRLKNLRHAFFAIIKIYEISFEVTQ